MWVKLLDPLITTVLVSSLCPTSTPCQQLCWPFSPFHSSSPSNSFYLSFLTAVRLQIPFYLPPAAPFSVCSYLLFVSVCARVFRPFMLRQPHTIHALFFISPSFSSSSLIIFCWQSCPPLTLFHIYAAHTSQHQPLLILQAFMLIQSWHVLHQIW